MILLNELSGELLEGKWKKLMSGFNVIGQIHDLVE